VNPLSAIGNFFKAAAAYFGWAQQRDAEKNSPTMQANVAGKTDAKIGAEIAEADDKAAKGDLTEARRLTGE
jgi:hypothetical protein